MGEIHRPLPGHHPENIKREQHALGMKRHVSPAQKVGDHIRPLPFGMSFLKRETSILLVTLSREAYVIKLDLIGPALRRCQRQSYVILLHFHTRWITPDPLPVIT